MTEDWDDFDLLRDYVDRRSQRAFTLLVDRHLGLVYSAALRQLGDRGQAEEVAHVTFIILARKAHTLRRGTILAGWLYRTARFVAQDAMKMNIRRKQRELEAAQLAQPATGNPPWAQIEPFLDEAVSGLGEPDRNAVLLRFFEDKSFAEVGAVLGISEEAARKRLSRALEKLRGLLCKRGTSVTVAALGALLSANAASAAALELVSAVAATAAAKGAVAGASTLTLTNSTLKLITWMKLKAAIITGAVVLLTVTTTIVAVKARAAVQDQSGATAATLPPDQPAAPASVGPGSPPASVVSTQTLETLNLSLDFNEATLAEAVHFLIVEGKRVDPGHKRPDIIVSPDAIKSAQPITLKLDDVSFQQALDSVCDTANVKYTLEDGVIHLYAMTEATSVPALPNHALPTESPASKATLAKLQSIVVDKVNFQNLDVGMALLFLTAKSRQFDPDHKGVNFVLGYIAPTDHIHRQVSVTLDNIPLSDLLTYINQQTNLRYSLGVNVVTFKP